jgi:hypothetical protein
LREELALVDRLLIDPAYHGATFMDELTERAARLRYTAGQIAGAARDIPSLSATEALSRKL